MTLWSRYKEQYRKNLALSLPVVLTQLGQMLTQLADTIMVGQFGGADPLPLAAVSFGSSMAFLILIGCIGVALGLTPLVGERFVRGEHQECSQLLHNAVIFYTLLGIFVGIAQYAAAPLLYLMGQPIEVVDGAIPYYRMLSYSIPFMLFFFGFKSFLEGTGNTKTVMTITIIVNALNVLFNWVLIYGRCGLPAMGATGAGLATTLSRVASAAMVLVYFLYHTKYRSYLRGFRLRLPEWLHVKQLLRIGLPIAGQMFLESSAFVGTAIMIGWLGTIALSANQVATTLGNCAFMVILSIGSAATIRISHCYGERNHEELKLATHATYHLVLLWSLLASLLFILLRHDIPRLFTDNEEVIALTADMMFFVALYQLWDGMQNVSVGILRGLQDVKIIMPIAFVAYWLINMPVGYLLGITAGMGPSGFFLSYSFGLGAAALLLMARIRRDIRKFKV
ncbi:MAG: MATE family efflux transporter [Rikenellaceae bacterium]|nr:MATE family efflux transporter [Rikenellaceae bacterium]